MDDRGILILVFVFAVVASLAVALHLWRSGWKTTLAVLIGALTISGGTMILIGNGMTGGFLPGLGWIVVGGALIAGPGLGMLLGLALGAYLGPYTKAARP